MGGISSPPDDRVYGVAWNGSKRAPTQDRLYDKIESMGGGGVTNSAGADAVPVSDGTNLGGSGTDVTLTGSNSVTTAAPIISERTPQWGVGETGDRLIVNGSGKITKYGNAAPEDGQLLIGNTADGRYDVGSITAGAGLAAVLSAGGINIGLSGERILSSLPVDMNTATARTLYTCPAGKTCVITRIVVRNASTSLTTASYSFGWNSASFNDVIANAAHTELTGSTLYTILIPKVGAALGTEGGTFKVLMNTLQGGVATTTMDVFGYEY